MNESSNRYFIKNTKNGNFEDITTLFDGVGVLKLEGMLNKGKPVNVYSEQWVNTQDEDFMITSSQEGVTKIIHENQDVSLTFIVRQTYAENQIDVQTVHDDFVAYLTGSDVWIRSNYVGGKMVHCVCLEPYEPTTVSLQRGLKSYIMGTIKLHSLGGAFDYFVSGNLVRVSLASQVDGLVKGKPYTNYLVYSENNGLVSVTITMGGADITSTAYNRTTKAINIPQVLGNVVINAESSPKIVFADQNVKSLCVTNWGGNYLQNEITEYEAAAVTSLGGVFRGNAQITSFDELRFLTGLTSLYISGNSTASQGEFYNCTNLASIKLPAVSLTNTSGAFRNTKIGVLDLSSLSQTGNMNGACHNDTSLTKVILPSITFSGISWTNTFRTCNNLTTIEIDGTADFSNVTTFNAPFYGCRQLEHITGTITGIKANIDFHWSPLTRSSALVIINGLAQVQTSQKVTFKYSTYNLLTDADIAIATSKNWQVETIVGFEDQVVKSELLQNFPNNVGLTYADEITNLELATITSLNGVFKSNSQISSFNELKYFTGITSLYNDYASSAYNGQLSFCSNLTKITLPAAPISNWGGFVRQTPSASSTALLTLDMTPITAEEITLNAPWRECYRLESLKIPASTYKGTMRYGFRNCTQLITIEIEGNANISAVTDYFGCFNNCQNLANIIGEITGIKYNLDLSSCPLTAASAMVILNGLIDLTGGTSKTLTLSSTTKSALTAAGIDFDAIAAAKNWAIE